MMNMLKRNTTILLSVTEIVLTNAQDLYNKNTEGRKIKEDNKRRKELPWSIIVRIKIVEKIMLSKKSINSM